jgi:hypothetical protein
MNCIICDKNITGKKYCQKCWLEILAKKRTIRKQNFCIDCDKEIWFGSKRCQSCENQQRNMKGKNNPNFGKHPTIEWRKQQSKRVKGKNNYFYIDGSSLEEYGTEFDSILKEQVRFRDGYKCQECGCSQLENGRQLDCHHIDYDKQNNIINNLIALCMKCHNNTNRNRIYWENHFKAVIKNLKEIINGQCII